jgi:hypothetical protein
MSLTRFLKIHDVREKFTATFPLPRCNLVGSMLAPPKTENYALVGTAFDYLMRFYLKCINPTAKTQEWVAEYAVGLIEDSELHKKAIDIITSSKKNYSKCMKAGEISTELIVNSLQLAQLDPVIRVGLIDLNLGAVDERDVVDLNNLLSTAKQKDFRAKSICVLNPTFGRATMLVGGADMDVLLDGSLIDVKTTKFLGMRRDYFNQLIGYYILSRIGGIHGVAEVNIENLAIYYSRHGVLLKIPVNEAIGKCDLTSFERWFIERALEEYPPDAN